MYAARALGHWHNVDDMFDGILRSLLNCRLSLLGRSDTDIWTFC